MLVFQPLQSLSQNLNITDIEPTDCSRRGDWGENIILYLPAMTFLNLSLKQAVQHLGGHMETDAGQTFTVLQDANSCLSGFYWFYWLYGFLLEHRSYNESHTNRGRIYHGCSWTRQGLQKVSKRKQEAAKKKWTSLVQQLALLFETKKSTIQDSNWLKLRAIARAPIIAGRGQRSP